MSIEEVFHDIFPAKNPPPIIPPEALNRVSITLEMSDEEAIRIFSGLSASRKGELLKSVMGEVIWR